MAIPTQDSWTSAHLEHPRESCEPVKAGQRRKCHIIDLAECLRIPEAGQRRKCHIIDLSECPGVAQAGQYRQAAEDNRPVGSCATGGWSAGATPSRADQPPVAPIIVVGQYRPSPSVNRVVGHAVITSGEFRALL